MRLVEGSVDIDDVDAFVERLSGIGESHGVTVQAFDARYVVSRAHLERAVELADRAFERGENVARDRGVEILLYAAGRRQIDRALTLGVSPGTQPVVVLVDSDAGDEAAEREAAGSVEEGLAPEETLGTFDEERVRTYFDVSDRELDAVAGTLEDVVLERVALLDVEK
ncbi:KEOPS complex component [Salinigranum rubrum]|uniref:KEOPS complex component n=1 Tax=Salinigranum rubrum TaxID=755307 RepID=A0A2I8VPC3_9EURY|nr:KEOPS complex subunit Cgi121 [Salinigranum rubrum]AUV83756.1 KEOPS complex component [Salinigranum rubrum]